jgi:predicted nucleic acid-binding Zn ribbon protein
MGKPGQCIEFSMIETRLTAVEHAIGRLWDMVGYASGKTSYAPSPAPSAPILEVADNAWVACPKCNASWNTRFFNHRVGDPCPKCAAPDVPRTAQKPDIKLRHRPSTSLYCPTCGSVWDLFHDVHLHPGDSCPKCSAQKDGE